jgi:hypothetical protein
VLEIIWRNDLPKVVFVMLNPSTANRHKDDATSRKCTTLADRWGYGGAVLVNLFGRRATSPRLMKAYGPAACGDMNDVWLDIVWERHPNDIIVAWGNHGTFRDRDRKVLKMMRDRGLTARCLGINKNGTPMHPLLVEHARKPQVYQWPV